MHLSFLDAYKLVSFVEDLIHPDLTLLLMINPIPYVQYSNSLVLMKTVRDLLNIIFSDP